MEWVSPPTDRCSASRGSAGRSCHKTDHMASLELLHQRKQELTGLMETDNCDHFIIIEML